MTQLATITCVLLLVNTSSIINLTLIAYYSSHLERPLEIAEPIKDVKAKEKGSAILTCKFSASPKEVHWFKGQVPLTASDKYNMKKDATRAQLTIQRLTEEDSGEYRCQSGPAETKGNLTVEGTVCTFKIQPLHKASVIEWHLTTVGLQTKTTS